MKTKSKNPRLPLSPLIVNLRTLAGNDALVCVVMYSPEGMEAIESSLDDVEAAAKLNKLVFAGFTPIGYLQFEGDTITSITVVQQKGDAKHRQEFLMNEYYKQLVPDLERTLGCYCPKLKKVRNPKRNTNE